MVEADTVVAGNRMLGVLGPAMRWAAEEDLILSTSCRTFAAPPRKPASRVLTRCRKSGRSGAPAQESRPVGSGQKLRPPGAVPVGDRAARATRPPRFEIRPHPRWHLEADRRTRLGPAAQPAIAAVGQEADRTRRRAGPRVRWPGQLARLSGFSKLKAALDGAIWRHRLAASTICAGPRPSDAGPQSPPRDRSGDPEPCRCPASVASIFAPNSEKQKAEALAMWAVALTRIVGKDRVVA